MSNLIKYDAAMYALQQAASVDEVKDMRDQAQAMAAYARQANNTEMVSLATEIKIRAERRAGEMLLEMEKNEGSKNKGKSRLSIDTRAEIKTLEQMGISHDQSSKWQKVAKVPEDKFEKVIADAKAGDGWVTTAGVIRAGKDETQKPKEKAPEKVIPVIPEKTAEEIAQEEAENYDPDKDPDALWDRIEILQAEIETLQDAVAVSFLPEELRPNAERTIAELRAENEDLRTKLGRMTNSRNEYQQMHSDCAGRLNAIERKEKKKWLEEKKANEPKKPDEEPYPEF